MHFVFKRLDTVHTLQKADLRAAWLNLRLKRIEKQTRQTLALQLGHRTTGLIQHHYWRELSVAQPSQQRLVRDKPFQAHRCTFGSPS